MPCDLQICDLLQDQYDDKLVCDYQGAVGVVTHAVKNYADGTLILYEGSRNIPDWYSNARFEMVSVAGIGRIEAGFNSDILSSLHILKPYIQEDKPIWLAGHSRGGSHANVSAAHLIDQGFKRENIIRTTFAPARAFDASGAAFLQGSPGTAYRNFGNDLDQDFVCDVPLHWMLTLYHTIDPWTTIDAPAARDDPWLFLRRHHLFLYRKGISGGQVH